jgi:hypothetical protein
MREICVILAGKEISRVAERAATARGAQSRFPVVILGLTLLEKLLVASVKHCSILALDMLYFRLLREDQHMHIEKRSERKRCMPWLMTD